MVVMSCCGSGTVHLLPLTSHAVDSPCHWPALTNSSLCLPSNSSSTVCTAPRQYICLCQHCKFCSAISSFCLARCVSMPPDGQQWHYVFDLSIHLCVRIGVCAYRHAGRGIQQSACHRVLWLFALGLVRYHKTLTSYFAGQMPDHSVSQILSLLHTFLECGRVHSQTPVFSRGCLLPCIWWTDVSDPM